MKKIVLIGLFLFVVINSYGRTIRSSPRSYSRIRTTVKVSKPKIVKVKPKTKTVVHKANPKKVSTINLVKPKEVKTTTSSSVKTINFEKPKSITSLSNLNSVQADNIPTTTIIRESNSNGGLGLFDYMMLNSLINGNRNQTISDNQIENVSTVNMIELIKYLEKEIKEEELKLNPDRNKIKKYKKFITTLKSKDKENVKLLTKEQLNENI